jgi:hypothetical protein
MHVGYGTLLQAMTSIHKPHASNESCATVTTVSGSITRDLSLLSILPPAPCDNCMCIPLLFD